VLAEIALLAPRTVAFAVQATTAEAQPDLLQLAALDAGVHAEVVRLDVFDGIHVGDSAVIGLGARQVEDVLLRITGHDGIQQDSTRLPGGDQPVSRGRSRQPRRESGSGGRAFRGVVRFCLISGVDGADGSPEHRVVAL
jgi:hypothetical protein